MSSRFSLLAIEIEVLGIGGIQSLKFLKSAGCTSGAMCTLSSTAILSPGSLNAQEHSVSLTASPAGGAELESLALWPQSPGSTHFLKVLTVEYEVSMCK